jgi:hypothetical protein
MDTVTDHRGDIEPQVLYHFNQFVQGGDKGHVQLDETKISSISGGTRENCPNRAIILRKLMMVQKKIIIMAEILTV